MPHKDKRPWLLCYDIADPKRLAKIARLARTEGIPLQYSVFLIRKDNAELGQMLNQICEIINEKEDDIRIYPVKIDNQILLGTQILPEGIEVITTGKMPKTA